MARVWKVTQTPVIAVWANVVFCALLGLIDLASFTAITAIFNVTAICVDWSCCIPVLCKVTSLRFSENCHLTDC